MRGARRFCGGLAALALSILAAGPARAVLCGTELDPLTVTATDIAFGQYSAAQPADLTPTGTITLSCEVPADVAPSFTVSLSTGMSGGFMPRQMKMGASTLDYNISTVAWPTTTVWGDGTGGTVTQTYSENLLFGSVTFTAYADLPAGQYVLPGDYGDQITVTVSY